MPDPVDATPKIQQALDTLAVSGGGTVYLPTGLYCLRGHLTVSGGTVLKGIFEAPPPTSTGSLLYQTVLLGVESKNNPSGSPLITLASRGSMLEGLTIYYPEQKTPSASAWTPYSYPPTVRTLDADAAVRNVMLLNSYYGMDLTHSGRVVVDGVWGQPLNLGINVDQSLDVGRISNVHFFWFWSSAAGVVDYVQKYATAFRFARADWEIVHDVFAYGYGVGMVFVTGADGVGTTGEMSNINFDAVGTGLDIYGMTPAATPYAAVSISNLNITITSIVAPGVTPRAIWARNAGYASNLNITNGVIWGSSQQSVLWEAPAGMLMLSGMRFQSIPASTPAVQVSGTGAKAMIQNSAFEGALPGKIDVSVISGAKAIITGNMLFGGSVPSPVAGVITVGNNQ